MGLFLMLGLTTVKKVEILSGFREICEFYSMEQWKQLNYLALGRLEFPQELEGCV